MRIVVGLRNPGSEYEGTRHNVGHEVVAVLARRHGGTFRRMRRTRCETATVEISGRKVLLAAPMVFMNQSGGPVRSLVDYYRLPLDHLLVVHDDIDLPFGRLRLVSGRGSGGHNGVRSLERSLGTNLFARLKVGVGRPPGRMDPAVYVLRRFSPRERPEVDLIVEDAADVVETWIVDPEAARELAGRRRPSPG